MGARIVERVDLGGVPDKIHGDLGRRRAEHVHFGGVELCLAIVEERLERHGVLDRADRRAVAACHIVDVIGRGQSAACRHVLRHDRRVARDVIAQMAGKGARVDIVTAADRGADDQPQFLAARKIRDAVGARPVKRTPAAVSNEIRRSTSRKDDRCMRVCLGPFKPRRCYHAMRGCRARRSTTPEHVPSAPRGVVAGVQPPRL